jgi:exonuclease-1
MGIKGLHKGLSFCTKKSSIREFSGQTVAVDSSSWLHRSVYSVSEKYVESIERKVVDANCVRVSARYISGRCRELLNSFRIKKVFLVMDGKRCPMKSNENEDREQRRQQNLKEARNYKRNGRSDKAEDKYKTCIKIRDDFTISVMKEVAKAFSKDQRVQFFWSPYEADAVITEVSR